MLSEISQRKTNIVWFHLYVESNKNKWTVIIKQKTESKIQRTNYGCQREGQGMGRIYDGD